MANLVGVDVGGTFTDCLYQDETTGEIIMSKVATTPRDQSVGLMKALQQAGKPLSSIGLMVHGTTVATNAVIERKGARCGLVTTKGFRDILEMGYRDRPRNYGLTGTQNPVIPRELRFEVTERVLADGTELVPLDRDEVTKVGRQLQRLGVESVVVSFLHSYINPSHERQAKEILEQLGDWAVVAGSDILQEHYEFERTSTAALTGYLKPIMLGYADKLIKRLSEGGFKGEVLFMQSNGGVLGSSLVGEYAACTIRSGPAAGVIAACALAEEKGIKDAISADMGGTSFDICLIADGKPRLSEESVLDFRIPLRTPMLEVHTIGAGGGSIAWLDRGGILRVGPQSAGAEPGPVCYGKGNTEPTVTDAHLILGHIDPEYAIGTAGEITLDRELAERCLMEKIGHPLGLSKEKAALAILKVVNANMEGRMRLISVERGYDPRRFVLIIFGGAGPLHAVDLMKGMSISKCIVPNYPGTFCAWGCMTADIRHGFVQTVNKKLDDIKIGDIRSIADAQGKTGNEMLKAERVPVSEVKTVIEADMMYSGQRHSIKVPFPSGKFNLSNIRKWFEDKYKYTYGLLLPNIPISLVSIRTTVIGLRPKIREGLTTAGGMSNVSQAVKGTRSVLFEDTWIDTPVYDRLSLPRKAVIHGPTIIEQPDSTTLVSPDCVVEVDELGNLILEVHK